MLKEKFINRGLVAAQIQRHGAVGRGLWAFRESSTSQLWTRLCARLCRWVCSFRSQKWLTLHAVASDFCHIFESPVASGIFFSFNFISYTDSFLVFFFYIQYLWATFIECFLICQVQFSQFCHSMSLILLATLVRWVQLLSLFWCGNWGIERLCNLANVTDLVTDAEEYKHRESDSRGSTLDHYVTLHLGKPLSWVL